MTEICEDCDLHLFDRCPANKTLLDRIFDWIDIQVLCGRYNRAYAQYMEFVNKRIERRESYNEDWEKIYEQQRARLVKYKNRLDESDHRLRVRRAMSQPTDPMQEFDRMKLKRLNKIKRQLPGGYIISKVQ